LLNLLEIHRPLRNLGRHGLSAHDLSQNDLRERCLLLFAPVLGIVGSLLLGLCGSAPAICNASLDVRSALLIIVSTSACYGSAHVVLTRYAPHRDPLLLPTAAMLTTWGLLVLARLAPGFLSRQVLWLFVSTIAMLGVVTLSKSLDWLYRFRYTWLFAGLGLLAATLVLGTNPSGYGPRLWLGAGSFFFQPSELLKVLMIAYVASYFAEKRQLIMADELKGPLDFPSLTYVGPLLAMFGVALVLLAWQQDLGAAMIFFFTFLAMSYLATSKLTYVATGVVLIVVAGFIGYHISDRVALRVDIWLNPWTDASGRAFQIVQSLLAVAAGGLVGQGLGMGVPSYIPAVHTDFVFAALGEEFGLAGLLPMILLFLMLILRGFRAAERTHRPFETFLASGISAGFAVQSWIIMAGNTDVAPITGVTLPFVSYGGSSLLTSFVALGLLIKVSANQPSNWRAATRHCFRQPLRRVVFATGALFSVLAITSGFWSVARATDLDSRDDNPRKFLYEERIVRGRILDRNGLVLAGSEANPDGTTTRIHPVTQAAPVVGYVTIRYGTNGIELAFDDVLRGQKTGSQPFASAMRRILHRPQVGQDVQLALDAAVQTQAQEALQGMSGAVVVLNAENGEILALASSPTFDPDAVDSDWDRLVASPVSPLINRATQALYQPGTALQSVIVSELVIRGLSTLDTRVISATLPVTIDGTTLACERGSLEDGTLAEAYGASCPFPFVRSGKLLRPDGLADAVTHWHLSSSIQLAIPVDSSNWKSADLTTTSSLELEAIGQGSLTVSPLRMAAVAATLANDGVMPPVHVTLRVQDQDGAWHDCSPSTEPEQIIPADLAHALLLAWPLDQGFRVRRATAVAGKAQPPHRWFTGITPDLDCPRFVVTVLVEHAADPNVAARVGMSVLQALCAKK